MDSAPDIEAKYAGQRQNDNCWNEPADNLLTIRAQKFAEAGSQVFKYRNNGRERSKYHKDEEQGAPDPAGRHMVKYIGQRYEQQIRTASRIDTITEACRENNQPGHEGYKGVQDDSR